MAERNPHRRTARVITFLCYACAALVLGAGVLFTLTAAMMDLSQSGLEKVGNQRMAVMVGSIFLIIVVMIVLCGWRVHRLFGQKQRQNKVVAKSVVGCLRLSSLGCALWAVPSTVGVLLTGKMIANGEPAGCREIFVGTSGFVVLIILMLGVAWFISANFAHLSQKERERAFDAYQAAIGPYLSRLTEPEVRTYVQEHTMDVLTKLDPPLKTKLLVFLGESGLLSGDSRLELRDADFSRVDLRLTNLPRADLQGINLEHAILRGTHLFKANLQNARLKNADLSRANLQEADLRNADLTGAMLVETNLIDANLAGAKVTPEQRQQARLG